MSLKVNLLESTQNFANNIKTYSKDNLIEKVETQMNQLEENIGSYDLRFELFDPLTKIVVYCKKSNIDSGLIKRIKDVRDKFCDHKFQDIPVEMIREIFDWVNIDKIKEEWKEEWREFYGVINNNNIIEIKGGYFLTSRKIEFICSLSILCRELENARDLYFKTVRRLDLSDLKLRVKTRYSSIKFIYNFFENLFKKINGKNIHKIIYEGRFFSNRHLCLVIQNCPNLKDLQLPNTDIGLNWEASRERWLSEFVKSSGNDLREIFSPARKMLDVSNFKFLKKINITGCKKCSVMNFEDVFRCKNIEEINLSDTQFKIEKIPEKLLKLKSLNLKSCENFCEKKYFESIGSQCPNIEKLNLKYMSIVDDFWKKSCLDGILKLKNLKCLKVDGGNVECEDVRNILNSLRLEKFEISDSHITDNAMKNVINMTLKNFKILRCGNITDESFKDINVRFPNIENFQMFYMKVSNFAWENILKCPKLKILYIKRTKDSDHMDMEKLKNIKLKNYNIEFIEGKELSDGQEYIFRKIQSSDDQ